MRAVITLLSLIAVNGALCSYAIAGPFQDNISSKSPEEQIQVFLGGLRANDKDCDAISEHEYLGAKFDYDWYLIKCDSGQSHQMRLHFRDKDKFKIISCEDDIALECWRIQRD